MENKIEAGCTHLLIWSMIRETPAPKITVKVMPQICTTLVFEVFQVV